MKKLVFIGAGSMAEAMISGIVEKGLLEKEKIRVTNRSDQKKLEQLQQRYGVSISGSGAELFADADAVILAVKPKDAANAISAIRPFLTEKTLIISVLAGVSIESIEKLAGKELAVVRAMPNTSAAIGKSATALAVNNRVSLKQKKMAETIFNTIGLTAAVAENQLDAVTGLSGSGPAYIYYLVEAMEKSAAEIGLEKGLAKELIIQTLLGAAGMLDSTNKAPKQLRQDVTSPGGTTEAGIKVLEAHGVQDAFISCIKEATAQSKKLGSMLSSEINSVKQHV
ncbi:pyrroline-5-carboxylate reductase [Bacillus sp. V33-4]|uniref:pyrroline-5-carboxylate reductase n=1 Tax=Bacillus sp. V33-4 TaxID=2054169 RepID=UPI000C777226|nr:pyrroline-5-carboxylate reductase [Bacillus sp. V33-4]PLR84532.1 pyrroline-5-carboxylate reductase [Bacillus sp. V33-4]